MLFETRRSTEISLVIRQTMEACIMTHLMPRSQVPFLHGPIPLTLFFFPRPKCLQNLLLSEEFYVFLSFVDRYFCPSSASRWR